MTTIAERLTRIREALGLNKTEFAGRLDIPRETYFKYEDGRRRPPLETAEAIEQKLRKPPGWLYGYTQDDDVSEPLPIGDDARVPLRYVPVAYAGLRLALERRGLDMAERDLAASLKDIVKLVSERGLTDLSAEAVADMIDDALFNVFFRPRCYTLRRRRGAVSGS